MKKPILTAITSLKGGTGKTVITFNVAALLATKLNKRVLIIDMDAQHNMSSILHKLPKRVVKKNGENESPNEQRHYSTEDIFEFSTSADKLIKKTHLKNLDIIPTTIGMVAIEWQVFSVHGRELILKNWLLDNADYLSVYDYIFFDCNPTMSIINVNTYISCDNIILISDIDVDGIEAVETFLELYYPIQYSIDRNLANNVKGLIVNKVLETTRLTKDFMEYIKDESFEYQDILLENQIHNGVSISETKLNKEPVSAKRDRRAYNELMKIIKELQKEGIF